MERQEFEDKWQKAFVNAEVSPSESVWANIALDLDKTGDVNRKLYFYKLVAAASIIFAVVAGASGVYFYDQHALLENHQAELSRQKSFNEKLLEELTAARTSKQPKDEERKTALQNSIQQKNTIRENNSLA